MSKSKKQDITLFGDDEDNDAFSNGLGINKNYAERYDNWRGKEEMQKLKDKYGDVGLNAASDESTSESEDENAQELTKDVELEFFKTLSMLKSKDKVIYDKEKTKFFDNMVQENMDNETGVKTEKTKKPYQLKDLERDMVMEKIKKSDKGFSIDEDDDNLKEAKTEENLKKLTMKKSYFEEQEDIKKSLKKAIGSEDEIEEEAEEDDSFLKVKVKSKEQRVKEDADYVEWLKGKKQDIEDPNLKKNMECLHDYWTDPNLPEKERFLRDYILNKRYIDNEESDADGDDKDEDTKVEGDPKAPNMNTQPIDFVEFSDEEKIIENQEEFERKYNFRFEEPDPEFIKAYPRTIVDSVRREKNKRKEKREEYKVRKELEKTKKKEEIKRLKNLKRMEIMQKIERLKRVSGKEKLNMNEEDLERDFDPDEYEKRMQQLFDEDYNETPVPVDGDDDNDDDKPVFTDDEAEDEKYLNWDEWENKKPEFNEIKKRSKKEKKEKKKKRKLDADEDDQQDPEFDMDCEPEEDVTTSKRGKKMTKLAKALLKKKPTFNPDEKSFEEYFDEYYKLDCEDVIGGDLPCRFKYREVVPNDFGLNLEEIFASKDTELNQWASLKKATNYRPIKDEVNDVKVYKNKKNQLELKKKILQSFYDPENGSNEMDEDDPVEEEPVAEIESSKKSKKVKEPEEENDQNNDQLNAPAEDENVLRKSKKPKREKKPLEEVTKVEAKANGSQKRKNKKDKPKKKNKNILESIPDERLAAYGIEPKKFHKKLKYGGKKSVE